MHNYTWAFIAGQVPATRVSAADVPAANVSRRTGIDREKREKKPTDREEWEKPAINPCNRQTSRTESWAQKLKRNPRAGEREEDTQNSLGY